MISSPERITANQQNAVGSTGPKTPEGKEAARANGYKHGLTGAGIVQARAESAEVASLARKFREELFPVTEVGGCLLDEMAMLTVRIGRCQVEERNRLAAMNDGEGGLFDGSREGLLLQKYENAARRGFHKAYAMFRKIEAEARADGFTVPLPPTPVPVASSFPATPPPPPRVEIPGSPLDPEPAFAPPSYPKQPIYPSPVPSVAPGVGPAPNR